MQNTMRRKVFVGLWNRTILIQKIYRRLFDKKDSLNKYELIKLYDAKQENCIEFLNSINSNLLNVIDTATFSSINVTTDASLNNLKVQGETSFNTINQNKKTSSYCKYLLYQLYNPDMIKFS